MTALTISTTRLAHRHLLDDESWNRVVGRVMKEAEYQRDYPDGGRELAERIVNEALGFLSLCAQDRRSFGPSHIVDIGWHVLILYTRMYADLCRRLGAQFLHHEPNDLPGQEHLPGKCQACHDPCLNKAKWCVDKDGGEGDPISTVEGFELHGIAYDSLLWASDGACTDKVKCACRENSCRS